MQVYAGSKAIVTKTGYQTTKGGMIREIMYPKEFEFTMAKDAMYYIAGMLVLTIISACFFVPKLNSLGFSFEDIFFRIADILTTSIPPCLPAILTSCILFSIKRLGTKSIYCISPNRIIVCGRIQTVVFDKTGTLTDQNLSIKSHQASFE